MKDIILAIFAVVVIIWLFWRKQKFSVFKNLDIPGPEPSIFFGNLWELYRKTTLVCHREYVKKYGKVVGFYFGTIPIVLVTDTELLKKILVSDFHNFINRPPLFSAVGGQQQNVLAHLINLKDKRWKEVRSILTPSFTTSKMKMMSPIINNAIDTLLQKIDEKAVRGESFDIMKLYQGLTMDVIGRTAFGIQTDCQNNPKDPFLSTTRALLSGSPPNLLTVLAFSFPEFKAIWRRLSGLRLRLFNRGQNPVLNLIESVKEVIQDRRNDEKKRRNDLLQLMIDASMSTTDLDKVTGKDLTAGDDMIEGKDQKDEASNVNTHRSSSHRNYIKDNEILGNAIVFLLAGYGTTNTALSFTTHLLLHYPEAQQKIREEIDQLVAKEEKIDYASLHQLQYLDQVLTESLRIYPPVYAFVNREVGEDLELGSLKLKKGFTVQVPVHLMQHDEEFWSEPEKFHPERFAPANKGNINPMAFQAFGAGPRNCVGMRFAQMEAKLALARILQKYKLVTCDQTDKLDIELRVGTVGLAPEKGVYLKAVPI